MIKVIFECGGCFKSVNGTEPLRMNFMSANGKGYGLGAWKQMNIQDIAPEGWIAYDPYSYCCYCPKCWAEICGDEKAV